MLSVVSVMRVYCDKTTEAEMTQFTSTLHYTPYTTIQSGLNKRKSLNTTVANSYDKHILL